MNVECATDPLTADEVDDFLIRHVEGIAEALSHQDYVERLRHFSEEMRVFALHSARAAQAVESYARGLISFRYALQRIHDVKCDEYRFSVEAGRERRRGHFEYVEIRDSQGMVVNLVRRS